MSLGAWFETYLQRRWEVLRDVAKKSQRRHVAGWDKYFANGIETCYLNRCRYMICTAWNVSIFGVFVVRIFPHLGQKISKYWHFPRCNRKHQFIYQKKAQIYVIIYYYYTNIFLQKEFVYIYIYIYIYISFTWNSTTRLKKINKI